MKQTKTNSQRINFRHPIVKYATLLGTIVIFVGLFLVVLISGYERSNPPQIYAISEPLSYGKTTLTGVIKSDSSSATNNPNYYLVLPDERQLLISQTSTSLLKANMLGQQVLVNGAVVPVENSSVAGYLTINTIHQK